MFGVNRWFATDEDDGLIERELYPSKVENRDGTVPYQIEVYTGDERFAGTNANVFIQIYGMETKTEQKTLNDRSDNFERGKMDQFKLEDVDVGEIQKIRIGHDDDGLAAGWFLGKGTFSLFYSAPHLTMDRPLLGRRLHDQRFKNRTPTGVDFFSPLFTTLFIQGNLNIFRKHINSNNIKAK